MSPEGTAKKFNPRIAIGIVVLVLAVIFIAQNTNTANITILTWDIDIPMWIVLVVMFILGMLLGGAVRGGIRKLRGADSKN